MERLQKNIENVSIESGVTSISYGAFLSCNNLTNISISDTVTYIGGSAFRGCSNLKKITIPDSVTNISSFAFYDCSALESITLGKGVTFIGSTAFHNCKKLSSVYISDLTSWFLIDFNTTSSNPLTQSAELYLNNELVTEITVPNTVTKINNSAFCGFANLKSITIPNTVTHIGNFAFQGCIGLTNVIIPNSVTFMGNYAFRSCINLTEITIGSSLSKIYDDGFIYCENLKNIYINSDSIASSLNSSTDSGHIIEYAETILFRKDTTTVSDYVKNNFEYKGISYENQIEYDVYSKVDYKLTAPPVLFSSDSNENIKDSTTPNTDEKSSNEYTPNESLSESSSTFNGCSSTFFYYAFIITVLSFILTLIIRKKRFV